MKQFGSKGFAGPTRTMLFGLALLLSPTHGHAAGPDAQRNASDKTQIAQDIQAALNALDYDAAIESTRRASVLWPDDAEVQSLLGYLYFRGQCDFETAETVLSKAISLDPTDEEAHLYLAASLLFLGDHDAGSEAMRGYGKAAAMKDRDQSRNPDGQHGTFGFAFYDAVAAASKESWQAFYRATGYSFFGFEELAVAELDDLFETANPVAAQLFEQSFRKQGYFGGDEWVQGGAQETAAILSYVRARRADYVDNLHLAGACHRSN